MFKRYIIYMVIVFLMFTLNNTYSYSNEELDIQIKKVKPQIEKIVGKKLEKLSNNKKEKLLGLIDIAIENYNNKKRVKEVIKLRKISIYIALKQLVQSTIDKRNFFMWFTTWPPWYSIEDVNRWYEFIKNNSDIVSYHFDNWIPWIEALNWDEYSQHLKNDWNYKKSNTPDTHKLFISITPINFERSDLAWYWWKSEGMPLPSSWQGKKFNDSDVKKAFLTYARDIIEYFNPDYLALGIESNMIIVNNPENREAYKELHKYVYSELKKDYSDLPIFNTVSIMPLNSVKKEIDANYNLKEVNDLCYNHCDLIWISAYPYWWDYWPAWKEDQLKDSYFDVLEKLNKKIAISETWVPSRDFSTLWIDFKFNEAYQKKYIEILLKNAKEKDFEFVIIWTGIDFDKLIEVIPDWQIKEIAKIWLYTWLETYSWKKKSAYYIWKNYFEKEYY